MSSSLFRFQSSEVYRAETLYTGFPTARRCSVSLNFCLTPHLSWILPLKALQKLLRSVDFVILEVVIDL